MANKRPVATLAVLGGIIAVLILLGSGDRLGLFGGWMSRLLNPLASGFQRLAGIVNPSAENLISVDEAEKLREENRRLIAENAELQNLEEENRRLREYLGFSQSAEVSLAMAEVIAQGAPGDSFRNREVITLNRGERDGFMIGFPIVSPEGTLIGKVTATKDHLSEVCLLYSPDCRLAVALAEGGGTLGVAQGDLGLTVRIDFIPQTRTLTEGQMIVTSGLEANMPAGLVVGRISRVIKQGNELWQSALVEPVADFENLRFVALLK